VGAGPHDIEVISTPNRLHKTQNHFTGHRNTREPSQYITNTKVNSAFHPYRVGNRVPACLAGLRWGAFTCVGWQETLCDLITYGKERSAALRWFFYKELYTPLT